MKLIVTSEVNYAAKIIQINEFRPHSNPEVNRLKCCNVGGFNIITGIDSEPGLYVYFPALSKINPDFLSFANLYRDKDLNKDPGQSGMFEANGRVKAIKLKGEISEGFILPLVVFENYITSVTNKTIDNLVANTDFDTVEDGGKQFWISKKYKPTIVPSKVVKTKGKIPKGMDKVIETQFRFHYTTVLIKKEPNVIQPNSIIHLSYKIHGTSGVSAYVLCKKPLNWKYKIAKWLTGEQFNKYDYLYSSRTVIKNKYYNKNVKEGFYGVDVWGEANKVLRPYLTKGLTLYYEIVGYLPDGKYIQKGYDYGCVQPVENEPYTSEKHFKVRIYRVTYTNVDGVVYEFTPRQVQWWCNSVGLIPVEECYYGLAKDLYPDIPVDSSWCSNFINTLANDKRFYMELDSPHCNNKVPHEGLVIKIDDDITRAFKLKCFKFLGKEQELIDNGNIEDDN